MWSTGILWFISKFGINVSNQLIAIIFLLTLTSCVFVPVVSENESNCILQTQKLELQVEHSHGSLGFHCTGEACMAVLAVASAVSISTFIVSGSVVLIGNTFHWLEKEGSCDDGFIKTRIDEYFQFLGVDNDNSE